MSDEPPLPPMSLEQQLVYARDLRRVYDLERERRRELEEANRALEKANAELDRRLDDLLAAQDWILAVNSTRQLPQLMDLLAQPLVLLLRARATVVFPWDPATRALVGALGHGIMAETPPLVALRTSPLTAAVLAAGQLWEAADLEAADMAIDCSAARALGWRALVGMPLVARGEPAGLLYVAWAATHELDERERTLLHLVAQHAAVSLANARILEESASHAEALRRAEQQQVAHARDLQRAYEREQDRRTDVQAAYLATVKALAAAIETRDTQTDRHVARVGAYAVAIGRELGWDAERLAVLELGAALHDVGKLAVPDALLGKPSPLDPAELAQVRQHAEKGARLLRDVPVLVAALGCVLRHHERYDGRGYPDGLAGDQIPVEARVVAVADAFDAMISDRPYRSAMPVSAALAEIERQAGAQFDPDVVAAFLRGARAGTIVAGQVH